MSISVVAKLSYNTIAKLVFITWNYTTFHTSKVLTVANQTQVPILHYVILSLNTSIEDNSHKFKFPLAVADII